jgi:tRNA (cytidine/uridine-2'-O-)-methyltransferase
LFSTKATQDYRDFVFQPKDILLFGRESAGVPDHVHQLATARLLIPLKPQRRSLNLSMAAAIASAEALRQLR